MGVDNRIFTDGKVGRVLFKFALPAIISLFVAELYNMVDTFYVGRFVGPNAIAALTIAFPIQRLLMATGILVSIGVSTAVARYLGEENYDDLKKSINNAFILTIFLLTVIPLAIFLFKEPIITKLGASAVIYPYAEKYISIILIGGLFQCLTLVSCYIMTALGNTKITLLATSLGAILNIIIDFILVVIFPMGVMGAAISTVVSQIISFIFAIYKFSKVGKAIDLKWSFKLDMSITKAIVAIGFSSFVIEISDAIVAVLLNNILAAKGGDAAIVIVGVVTRISMFLYITVIGISSAMQPIAAFNYGAKNYKRLKEVVRKAIKAVCITSAIIWAIMMILPKPIIGSFLQEKELLGSSIIAFRVCISFFPVLGIYYVSIYLYQAIEEAKSSFMLSIYRQLILFIPLVILLVNVLGTKGAWITFPITDVISAATGFYYIKKASKIIEEEQAAEIEGKNVKSLNFS